MSGIKSKVNGIVIASTSYVDTVVRMGGGKYAHFVGTTPRAQPQQSVAPPAAGVDLAQADAQDEQEEAVAEVASPEAEETQETPEEASGRRGRRGQPVEQL
jgi:hypothetical protein